MIYTSEDEVKDMFRYHPVDNPERAEAHDNLNLAAQAFAIEMFRVTRELHDYPLIDDIITEIQVLRMLGNLYITYVDVQSKRQQINAKKYLTEVIENDLIEE